MKIGVAGSGAVGGYYGGLLKRAGNDVVFLARGKKYERLKENGLTIAANSEKFTVEGVFTENYQEFADVDLVLFCVKATATAEVADKLASVLKKSTLVMTLQNGVDNEEILGAIFGSERVLSAAAYIQTHVDEAGVVQQIGVTPKLLIGALDHQLEEKLSEIAELFNSANLETYPTSDILKTKWSKLLWNVTFNPLTALIESKVGAVYEDSGLLETAVNICKEAIRVGKACGVELEDDYFEIIMAQGQLAREHHTSMLQDRLKDKPMELESIAGYIVKKAKELGVDVPVLQTVYHLLSYASKG